MNMSQKVESLLYKPLQHHDSFRLLKLNCSASESEWTATLIEARLPQQGCPGVAPKYVALSYVCGDSTFDVPSEDAIEIRSSVSTALGHILQGATLSGTLTIWIDQFCINQRNVKEKEQQINMMGRIFAGAVEVIGWLGPPFEGSEETLDDLIVFAGLTPDAPEVDRDNYTQLATARLGDELLCIENVFAYIGQVMQLGSGLRNRMKHLFALPWFRRRWIAQEVCLASTLRIHCGYRSLSGEQLFRAINMIQAVILHGAPAWLNRPFRNAYSLLQMRKKVQDAARGNSCLSFPHIIQSLSHLDCEKVQDRINALLGMVPSNALWFSADSRPSPKLFVDFALKHMQQFKSLEILHFAGVTDPEEIKVLGSTTKFIRPAEDLPSWVPDWRIRQRQLPITSMDKDTPDYNISPSAPEVTHDSTHNTLTLRGKLLDATVDPCMAHLDQFNLEENPQYQYAIDQWSNGMFLSYLHALDPWLAEQYHYSPSFAHWLQTVESAGKSPRDMILCFARTTIMNGMVRSTERPDFMVPKDQILDYFLEYAKLRLVVDSEAAIVAFAAMADNHKSMEKVAAYGYLAEHICRYRTVFMGSDGVVGLGAASISPGDRICFFSGLETPFIVHTKGNRFELRGECYVDGMMDIPYDELRVTESQIVLV